MLWKRGDMAVLGPAGKWTPYGGLDGPAPLSACDCLRLDP